eukprot:SAG22_NODE_7512_length_732_cov_1.698262_1_plen_28_part_10
MSLSLTSSTLALRSIAQKNEDTQKYKKG